MTEVEERARLLQVQLNRRVRSLEPELRVLQRHLAETLADHSEVYHVLDTTLIPAIVRVRACRKGLFAGQASFGRRVSEWIYGFKVALSVNPEGVIAAFGLAPANAMNGPSEFLVAVDGHDAFLADKGFPSLEWERRWLEEHGALLVAATPQASARRAWADGACQWTAGKRQIIEGVIWQLKDLFGLDSHRAKTLGGLLTQLAAKVAAYTCEQLLNAALGRPLRNLATLLI